MKKKIEKKNQRSLHTGTYQTKNKKSLSIPKKSNSKTQEKITKESKRSLGAKSFTRNNNLWPCLRKYLKFNHKT